MNKVLEKITCPQCHTSGTWREDNPYRPFCSERCKLIDLGEWADESHKIQGETANPDYNQFPINKNDDQ